MTPSPTYRDILLRAAENVRERGWVQGEWGKCGGAQCLDGHLKTARAELGASTGEFILARCCVDDHCSESRFSWNDTPGRSATEVIAALEEAAR